MDGQGFVPVGSAAAPAGAAPAQAPGAPAAAPGAPASEGSLPAAEGLKTIVEVLGKEYGEPIVAADGTIYMEKKKPEVVGGRLTLSYIVVGKVDRATGRMKVNPEIVKKVSAASAPERKLVKVDDQWVWQTFQKGKDGQVVALVEPASEAELAAYQQQQQAAATQQAAQAGMQNRGDWQQKVGVIAQGLGVFGSLGQFVGGLGAGPNPYTGKPGAGWISAWILAQRLNGKAEGKLLPAAMQSGPIAQAMEWGIQAYGMLDMGRDIKVVRDYLSKAPAPPLVNPNAVQDAIAAGTHPAMAGALNQLGTELRDGTLQLVEGSPNAAVLNAKTGTLQLVPKDSLHKAMAVTDAATHGGIKAREAVDSAVVKGAGMLKGLVQPAMIGATALGLVSSAITVKNLTAKYGAKSLLDTQQGRGALLGAVSSAAFLGMYLVPMVLPGLGIAAGAIGAASSAVNIAANVLGGVQMLNSYGLFGDDGFLNNDAFRAAFLIPPLTPIGAFSFFMKNRKKKAAAEAAKLEAAQKLAVERIQQQREMVKLQLQQSGQVAGVSVGADGTMQVPTSVPNDLSQLAAQLSGSPASGAPPAASAAAAPSGAPSGSAIDQQRQQQTMAMKPMR